MARDEHMNTNEALHAVFIFVFILRAKMGMDTDTVF